MLKIKVNYVSSRIQYVYALNINIRAGGGVVGTSWQGEGVVGTFNHQDTSMSLYMNLIHMGYLKALFG